MALLRMATVHHRVDMVEPVLKVAPVGVELERGRLDAARVRNHAISRGDTRPQCESRRSSGELLGDVGVDERQELVPGLPLVAEHTKHPAGDEVSAALADAAVDHAVMRGLYDHGDAAGLQHLVDCVGDLRGKALLNLQPLGEDLDHPRQLGNSHHPLVGNVADPHPANDRRDMVLAMALEGHAAQNDHLVITVDLAERLASGPRPGPPRSRRNIRGKRA